MVHRRQFLRTFGAGSAGALLAGCSALDDGSPDAATDDGSTATDPPETDTDGETETATDEDGGAGTPSDDGTDTPEETESGETDYETELIRITAAGADLGPRHDDGHFYYEGVSGDFDVSVHAMALTGSTGWEKAGIMVRASTDPEAPHLMVRRNPDGADVYEASPTSIQWRTVAGEASSARDGISAEWLRLTREGDTFTVSGSMTGENWEEIASLTTEDAPVGDEPLVGLAVTGMEEHEEPTATATFKDLSGLDPETSEDLGDPQQAGSVETLADVPVVSTAEPERAPAELTLVGNLHLPDGAEPVDCRFEYRRTSDDEWQSTAPRTVESGRFTTTVDAESRRLYQFRAIADADVGLDGATPTEGATAFRGTPSPGGSGDGGDLSPGISTFGPGDGFADPAPWLDDDTPVIPITEPSMEQLDHAFRTPHERLVVFDTSGTIDMGAQEWSIRADKCYLAGQTAPSPGITFTRGSLQVAADDCVVQHVRVRAGIAGQEDGWAPTGLHTQDERSNNVIDHCSVTWAIDENLTVGGYGSQDTTLTNNLAAEGLADATHPKGIHSYGSLIKDEAGRVVMLGNVWAHNVGRNPRLKTGTTSVVANNVMYHFDEATNLDDDSESAIVGNVYRRVDEGDYNVEGGRAYLEDNATSPDTPMTNDVTELDLRPEWPEGLETMPSGDVLDHGLANAGARPADRTEHDERILQQVREREGDWIDSEAEVGGYPDLPENTHELEIPDSDTHGWLREWAARVEET